VIRLVVDSRAPGTCRNCGAALDWFETAAGRRMPMHRGAQSVSAVADDPRLAFFSEADAHWRACPAADRFRRSRPRSK
jgi:hypothetical protein